MLGGVAGRARRTVEVLPPGFEPGLEGVLGRGTPRLEGPLSLTGLDYGSTTSPERRSLFAFGPRGSQPTRSHRSSFWT